MRHRVEEIKKKAVSVHAEGKVSREFDYLRITRVAFPKAVLITENKFIGFEVIVHVGSYHMFEPFAAYAC